MLVSVFFRDPYQRPFCIILKTYIFNMSFFFKNSKKGQPKLPLNILIFYKAVFLFDFRIFLMIHLRQEFHNRTHPFFGRIRYRAVSNILFFCLRVFRKAGDFINVIVSMLTVQFPFKMNYFVSDVKSIFASYQARFQFLLFLFRFFSKS